MAYLMGCQVHFNCKSGKDRTSVIALESHLVAARIHEDDEVPTYVNKLAAQCPRSGRSCRLSSRNQTRGGEAWAAIARG